MTRRPRRAPSERATIDDMEHVRTGVQRRTLIGAGIAILAFGGVMGAFAATDDSGSRRQEISDTQETTTTEATTSTVEAPTTTEAPVMTAAPTTAAPAPAPLEVIVEDHEERISELEAVAEPAAADPTAEAITSSKPESTTTVPAGPTICHNGLPMGQYGCP